MRPAKTKFSSPTINPYIICNEKTMLCMFIVFCILCYKILCLLLIFKKINGDLLLPGCRQTIFFSLLQNYLYNSHSDISLIFFSHNLAGEWVGMILLCSSQSTESTRISIKNSSKIHKLTIRLYKKRSYSKRGFWFPSVFSIFFFNDLHN